MMNYNSETVKTIICEEYAKFVVEKYITEYGIDRFQKVKPIFADVAVSIFLDYISSKCTQDEWNESDHPRDKDGKFTDGCGGGASSENETETPIEGDNAVKYFSESEHHKEWENNLTETEKDTIYGYTVDRYKNINNFLRQNNGDESGDLKLDNEIADLDNAIQKYKLENPITAYRVVQNEVFQEFTNNPEKLIGTIYNDKAFSSTTIMKEDVEGTPDCVLMKINIPKGKGRGAYINNLSEYKDIEHEFLIKRDSKFKITNAYKKDKVLNIEMELTD